MPRIVSAAIPTRSATASGVRSATASSSTSSPSDVGVEIAHPDATSCEEATNQRSEQQRIGARTDEVMLVGELRRLAAPRIDHDDPSAAFPNLGETRADAGSRHQAAVRDHRVRADHQQVIGAVEIRHRHQEAASVHPVAGELLGKLVEGVGAEAPSGRQRRDQRVGEENRAQVVDDGLSQVDRGCIVTVLALHCQDSLRGEVQGFPPPDALPSVPGAPDRMTQAVGIFVQVFERRGLRADLTPAERVALVAANRCNPFVLHLHFDSAAGFAQGAGPMNDAFHEDLLYRVLRFESPR